MVANKKKKEKASRKLPILVKGKRNGRKKLIWESWRKAHIQIQHVWFIFKPVSHALWNKLGLENTRQGLGSLLSWNAAYSVPACQMAACRWHSAASLIIRNTCTAVLPSEKRQGILIYGVCRRRLKESLSCIMAQKSWWPASWSPVHSKDSWDTPGLQGFPSSNSQQMTTMISSFLLYKRTNNTLMCKTLPPLQQLTINFDWKGLVQGSPNCELWLPGEPQKSARGPIESSGKTLYPL